jgi:hypothetical protein
MTTTLSKALSSDAGAGSNGSPGAAMSPADRFLDAHDQLALALLATEGGAPAQVTQAMRKMIASAPQGTDVALVLSLAMERAGDQLRHRDSASARPTAAGRVNRAW